MNIQKIMQICILQFVCIEPSLTVTPQCLQTLNGGSITSLDKAAHKKIDP